MQDAFFRKARHLPCLGFMLCMGVMISGFTLDAPAVYANTIVRPFVLSTRCPTSAGPTGSSLLAILLDRSGSLKYGTGSEPPTDPQGYSTSVTKALVDLWPGVVAVIPFSGNVTPVLGPATSSNPAERTNLKSSVEHYPIGGSTPLAPAMQQTLQLLRNAPSGSRVIVITDGSPANQENDIRSSLIPQFCMQGIPVGVFGLTIATNTPEGQEATHLLSDIARGTGSEYRNIEQSADLGKAVISLYAQWLHLTFIPVNIENGNAPLAIDSFVQQAIFITFGNDTRNVMLYGPDGQSVKGIQQFSDTHYVIDRLDGAGPTVNGIYTVSMGNTAQAQVYVLINSSQRVQFLAPLPGTVAYADRPIAIKAEFFDGDNILTPNQGQGHAVLTAYVTFLSNGKQVGPVNTVVLTEQGAIFSGQTLIYKQVGVVQIEIVGTYQGVTRQAELSIPLVAPLPTPTHCRGGISISCLLQQYHTQAVLLPLLAVILFAALLGLWWCMLPSPFGTLREPVSQGYGRRRDDKEPLSVRLGTFRTLQQRLLHKSVIDSREIERHPDAGGRLDFRTAHFAIQYRGRIAYIRQARGNGSTIKVVTRQKMVDLRNGTPMRLDDGSVINIDGKNVVVFSEN